MNRDEKINHLTSLIEACLLPELIQDFGTDFIESKHFDAFRECFDAQSIQIFDTIQQNEDLLYDTQGNTRKLRCMFTLLLCEQTANSTLYQTKNQNFLHNLEALTEKHFRKMLDNDQKLVTDIFDYYKRCFRKDFWKRNLGAIHSFDKFCELYYVKYENQLSNDLCSFMLSVSLLLEEFYEPSYKEMGFRLMHIILTRTDENTLRDLNLHNVIYETLVKDIPKISSKSGTIIIWDCLLECAELMKISDYSKWNKVDDLLEDLFRRITFESSSDICVKLFEYFAHICLIDVHNSVRKVLKAAIYGKSDIDYKNLRLISKEIKPRVFYKWAKKLLKLFVAESYRLLANESVAPELFRAIHISYIVCITTIPTKVCQCHLVEFFEKFTSLLMEVISVHKKNSMIVKNVEEFLETILHHISDEAYKSVMSEEVSTYQSNLSRLLEHDIFNNKFRIIT